MFMQKLDTIKLTATTDAEGAAVVSSGAILGRLYAVQVAKGTFDATADLTLAYADEAGVSRTLLTLTDVSADAVHYPRAVVDDLVGADIAGITALPIIVGAVSLTVAQGGNAKTGSVILVFERN